MGATAIESIQFMNLDGSYVPVPFTLKGGKYMMAVAAAFNGGGVQFQMLAPDGVSWSLFSTAFLANGVQVADVPPGQYRLVIGLQPTGVYASVTGIPS